MPYTPSVINSKFSSVSLAQAHLKHLVKTKMILKNGGNIKEIVKVALLYSCKFNLKSQP